MINLSSVGGLGASRKTKREGQKGREETQSERKRV